MGTANTVNSKKLSEALGKRHDNLLRGIRTDIEKLRKKGEDPEVYYKDSSYTDGKKQVRACYDITMEGCERLALKVPFSERAAFLARCKGGSPEDVRAYTVKEAADLAGISERTMRRKVASGEIPSYKEKYETVITAERSMIPAAELEKYLKEVRA